MTSPYVTFDTIFDSSLPILNTGGLIKVFIEYQTEPLAEYRDKNPLQIKYFGFASYDNSPNKYFYNCEGAIPDFWFHFIQILTFFDCSQARIHTVKPI